MSHVAANKVKALIEQGKNQLFQHAGMFHYDLTGVKYLFKELKYDGDFVIFSKV